MFFYHKGFWNNSYVFIYLIRVVLCRHCQVIYKMHCFFFSIDTVTIPCVALAALFLRIPLILNITLNLCQQAQGQGPNVAPMQLPKQSIRCFENMLAELFLNLLLHKPLSSCLLSPDYVNIVSQYKLIFTSIYCSSSSIIHD